MSPLSNKNIEKEHNSVKFHKNKVLIGDVLTSFEVGKIAKQASGSVFVRSGDSVVLVTACVSAKPLIGIDFFPLTCEYIEKSYSAGKIPGGFFKRETRPSEHEILNSRIIDRSIRPLFPDGYFHEVQIIATVLSHDGDCDTDVMALCGASMALHVSEIPFALDCGPIAGVRVGRIDGKLVINPNFSKHEKSDINIFVAFSRDSIVMVEGSANEISENDLIDALFFAYKNGQKIIDSIEDMRTVVGKEKISFTTLNKNESLMLKVRDLCSVNKLSSSLIIKEKKLRSIKINKIKEKIISTLTKSLTDENSIENLKLAEEYFNDIKKKIIRKDVINSKIRIDGRKYDEIRPICSEISVLPRTHGSAIFTRGETQALVTLTLGTREDEQRIDKLTGDYSKSFMLHYNFPPFCVGESRMLRSTSRREIGHGALAERAVKVVVPSGKDFPYTIRLVSEIIESNGSSSMATVCGASLAMLDGGIKIKTPVAGIAMGLIKEDNDIAILSDILGDEDYLGDMDFKVCSTENGITAIQMDIKIFGLSREILIKALKQARQGCNYILNEMKKTISLPKKKISNHAPKIISFRINPNKIRDVIGPGGKVIRDIIARTSAKVDVNDDGLIQISAIGALNVEKAVKIIEGLTREAEINMIYSGLVKKIFNFGAFIEIFPGTEGLCHISELANKRVNSVSDILQEGDEVNVVVLSKDREGKIRLSRKRAQGKETGQMI